MPVSSTTLRRKGRDNVEASIDMVAFTPVIWPGPSILMLGFGIVIFHFYQFGAVLSLY